MPCGQSIEVIRSFRCRDTQALFEGKPGQRRSKSLTNTEFQLVPPGEVLLEEFLRPMGISQYWLALAIGVPESRINAIVKGRRTITADTDLRLCRFFGLSEGFWLRMQGSHDLKLAKQALVGVLSAIEPIQQLGSRGVAQLVAAQMRPNDQVDRPRLPKGAKMV